MEGNEMTKIGELRVFADENQFILQKWTKAVGWKSVSYHVTLDGLAHSLLNRRARQHIVTGQSIMDALKTAKEDVKSLLGELGCVIEVKVVK